MHQMRCFSAPHSSSPDVQISTTSSSSSSKAIMQWCCPRRRHFCAAPSALPPCTISAAAGCHAHWREASLHYNHKSNQQLMRGNTPWITRSYSNDSSSSSSSRNTESNSSSSSSGPEGSSSSRSSSSGSLGRFMFGGGDGSFSRQRYNTGSSNSPSSSNSSSGSSSNTESSSSSSSTSGSGSNWALMGRVVQAQSLSLGDSPRKRMVLLVAANSAGVSEAEMERRVKELITLLPDLSSLLFSLNPATLAQLSSNTAGVALKLIQLRLWFPTADVAAMVSRRPTLLLDDQWAQVDSARLKLLARLLPSAPTVQIDSSCSSSGSRSSPAAESGNAQAMQQSPAAAASAAEAAADAADVATAAAAAAAPLQTSPLLDGLVTRQPLLLVANVDDMLDELARLMPGVSVLPLLERNPSLLLSVQRGSAALGPGAEFMGPG